MLTTKKMSNFRIMLMARHILERCLCAMRSLRTVTISIFNDHGQARRIRRNDSRTRFLENFVDVVSSFEAVG
ncbi:MAG TPA: hypothetical protein VMB81_23420, partial [Candidatus Sulfotelmatobacter sp.]|nr:hypothetical protein [Candidatus Sulfotelmatobacter sp.]